MHYTAKFRTHPPPQATGTVWYPMDVDDVPAAKGSRPDRLLDVSGPQIVDQLVDVLKIIDTTSSVEQVIKVPMIAFQDGIPPRRASRAAAGGTVGGGARALL